MECWFGDRLLEFADSELEDERLDDYVMKMEEWLKKKLCSEDER